MKVISFFKIIFTTTVILYYNTPKTTSIIRDVKLLSSNLYCVTMIEYISLYANMSNDY
jgi:hypothetical protein